MGPAQEFDIKTTTYNRSTCHLPLNHHTLLCHWPLPRGHFAHRKWPGEERRNDFSDDNRKKESPII